MSKHPNYPLLDEETVVLLHRKVDEAPEGKCPVVELAELSTPEGVAFIAQCNQCMEDYYQKRNIH